MTEKKYGWKKKLLLKKTPFLFSSTEEGRWRNFSLTFSESTKNLVVIIHRSQRRPIRSQLQHRLSDQCLVKCAVHVDLTKQPTVLHWISKVDNRFILQQALRAYCPNIYTVIVSQTWMGMGAKKIDILTKKNYSYMLHATFYISVCNRRTDLSAF